MASKFAAMFAQQQEREGWGSPNEEGSEDGREAPVPGAAHQVSGARKRTANSQDSQSAVQEKEPKMASRICMS